MKLSRRTLKAAGISMLGWIIGAIALAVFALWDWS